MSVRLPSPVSSRVAEAAATIWRRLGRTVGLGLASVLVVTACGGGGSGTGANDGRSSGDPNLEPGPASSESWDSPGSGPLVPTVTETTPATRVLTGLLSPLFNAWIVLDDAGNGLVVWAETADATSTAVLRAIRYQVGLGWSTPEVLDPRADINGAHLAVDAASGRAVASWIARDVTSELNSGRVMAFDPATGAWTRLPEPGLETIPGRAFGLRSVIGPDGSVSSVWMQEHQNEHPGLRRLYASDHHPDGGYGAPSRVDLSTPENGYSNATDLLRLADGRLALAWSDAHKTATDPQSAVELKAAIRAAAGGAWQVTSIASQERAVAQLSTVQPGTTMVFTPDGQGLFTYVVNESVGGRSRILMRRYVNGWQAEQVVAKPDGSVAGEAFSVPRAGINRAGTVAIGWFSVATDTLRRVYGVRGQSLSGQRMPETLGPVHLLDTGSLESDRNYFRLAMDDWGRSSITWSDTVGGAGADRSASIWSIDRLPGGIWQTPVRLDEGQSARELTGVYAANNRFGDRIVVWTPKAPGPDGMAMAARVDRTQR